MYQLRNGTGYNPRPVENRFVTFCTLVVWLSIIMACFCQVGKCCFLIICSRALTVFSRRITSSEPAGLLAPATRPRVPALLRRTGPVELSSEPGASRAASARPHARATRRATARATPGSTLRPPASRDVPSRSPAPRLTRPARAPAATAALLLMARAVRQQQQKSIGARPPRSLALHAA